MILRDTAPDGPLAGRWQRRRNELALVGPTRRRQHQVIVVGAGLAGASAAATLGELGYRVRCLTFHDSPRRAHSVAAQGGINAARDAANDGDSVERLFHDTLEGGDFRSRESNVYRLAELSARIIDQAVAQGVPFAREYGGQLATRSFGGALVSRTFYARGQTGQQLLLGAYQALSKEVARRHRRPATATGGARPDRGRRPRPRHRRTRSGLGRARGARGRRRGPRDRRLRQRLFPVHQRQGLERHGHLAGAPARRRLRQPGLRAVPPHVPAGGRRAPGQAHAHVRVAAQRRATLGAAPSGRRPTAGGDSRGRARLLPRASLSALRQPGAARPRARARPRRCATRATAWGRAAARSTWTCATRRRAWAPACCASATATSSSCTSTSPATIRSRVPMRISPAAHYTMGGLWVDYDLMSTVPGLFVIGEANFSDHGANRLGASALMQGLADGYFILPCTLAGYLAGAALSAGGRGRCGRQGRARERCTRGSTTLLGPLGTPHGERLPPRARAGAVGGVRARAPAAQGLRQGDRRDRRAAGGVLGGPDRARRSAAS